MQAKVKHYDGKHVAFGMVTKNRFISSDRNSLFVIVFILIFFAFYSAAMKALDSVAGPGG